MKFQIKQRIEDIAIKLKYSKKDVSNIRDIANLMEAKIKEYSKDRYTNKPGTVFYPIRYRSALNDKIEIFLYNQNAPDDFCIVVRKALKTGLWGKYKDFIAVDEHPLSFNASLTSILSILNKYRKDSSYYIRVQ